MPHNPNTPHRTESIDGLSRHDRIVIERDPHYPIVRLHIRPEYAFPDLVTALKYIDPDTGGQRQMLEIIIDQALGRHYPRGLSLGLHVEDIAPGVSIRKQLVFDRAPTVRDIRRVWEAQGAHDDTRVTEALRAWLGRIDLSGVTDFVLRNSVVIADDTVIATEIDQISRSTTDQPPPPDSD